jgi:hypothetical protein
MAKNLVTINHYKNKTILYIPSINDEDQYESNELFGL